MKRFIVVLLIAFAFIAKMQAQSSFSGNVFDENSKSIFFATAILYNQTDSSIAKSSSTGEKGDFKIKGIKAGNYYLKVRFIGYEDIILPDLEFPRDNNKTLPVKMEPAKNELSEVVVNGKKPLLQQESDRLIVNVADNLTSNNNTLMDVMQQVPGVIVMGDNISLAGSSNLTILINGKTTKYMDMTSLLKDMPGDNIEKVEVIHQPGAEFDAAGSGPIINVILKKNSLFGTFGSVKAGVSKGDAWRYNTNASFNHYQGSVNISGSIGYRNSEYKSMMDIDRLVVDTLHDQTSHNTDFSESYRGNLNIDWNIDKRHRVGVQSRFVNYFSDDLIMTDLDISTNDVIRESSITRNDRDGLWKLGSINPYYTFEIDSLGQKLELDLNYIEFGSDDRNNMVEEDMIHIDSILGSTRMYQPGTTKITVAKLDYTYPFSEYLKLQLGAKYSFADLDNNFQSEYIDSTGIWARSNQSNHYLFDETITAGYGKLSYNKGKWSGTLGLRYEESKSNGQSVGSEDKLSRNIAQFFPSASISREIIKGLKGNFAYSYRLERPGYSSLNPFRYNLDAHTFEEGNTNLRPEFTHSMKFSLSYQNQPFFNVEYKRTNDPITQVLGQDDNTGDAFRRDENLDLKSEFNISLFFPLDFIPKISGYGGIIVNNQYYDTDYLDETYEISKWDYTAFLQMKATLPGKILAELSGYYVSGGLDGTMTYEHMYGASIGFSRKFLNDRAKVNIGVRNFVSRFFYGKLNYSNLDVDIYNKWEAPVFNLQLTYNFGNKHLTRKNHESGASEELQRTGRD